MLAFNQYIVTKMDNESINFAIDVANSVLFQIAADNNCNKVVRYGHKKRTVKFYEGRKLILLVQIIRCTVIHEDQTEEQPNYFFNAFHSFFNIAYWYVFS